jgi:hypothetical protein
MYKYSLLTLLLVLCTFMVMAQKPDTTKTTKLKSSKDTLISTRHDTIVAREFKPKVKKAKVYNPDSLHSPHTAVMRSLFVPGLGQIYNHKWWKVPVIYGGLTLLAIVYEFNTTYYHEFLALSIYREHGVNIVPGIPYYLDAVAYAGQPDQALYDAEAGYARDRDLAIFGFVGLWGINIVDAYIDAKFIHSYTVDNNLSLKVTPAMLNQPVFALNSPGSFIPGIKITFTLR